MNVRRGAHAGRDRAAPQCRPRRDRRPPADPPAACGRRRADHVLGLPGMMKTFALRGRDLPLTVYGPRGLGDLLNSLKRVVGKLTYDVRLVELTPGEVLERDGYRVATFGVTHGVSALGWS